MIISDWNDLKKYGIQYLTGESCVYGLRILCDVNDYGKRLIEGYFGVHGLNMPYKMNPTVNGEDSVGCLTLPREIFVPLAKYCLFHEEGCYAVHISGDNSLTGLTEDQCRQYLEGYEEQRKNIYFNFGYNPDPSISRNGRNIHQFTGRVM